MPAPRSLFERALHPFKIALTKPYWPAALLVVRHGESEHNVARDLFNSEPAFWENLRNVRDADIQLTARGLEQARQTGVALAAFPKFDVCIASPYERTMQTARAIAGQLPYHLEIEVDELVREKEFGHLQGFHWDEIKAKFPEQFEFRKRDGVYYYRPPGGQSFLDKMEIGRAHV